MRNFTLHRHKGGEFGHVDFAHLLAGVAGISSQRAEHIAGANFFLAPALNL